MQNQLCYCFSQKRYDDCCGRFISGQQTPLTPEALMRSRYTAYVTQNIDYIRSTMQDKALANFDYMNALQFASSVKWVGLQVINNRIDNKNTNEGFVEFKATYLHDGNLQILHEKSKFLKKQHSWYYVDGEIIEQNN